MYAEMEPILREAITAVARAAGSDLVTWPQLPWSARPAARLRPLVNIAEHDHLFPELCIAVRGAASMQLGGRWFVFEPPACAIVNRQIMHAEARRSRRSGYCLLWMNFHCSSLLGHASVYEPGRGRYCAGRVRIHAPVVKQLRDLFRQRRVASQQDWAHLRSLMLQTLSAMHREVMDGLLQEPDRSDAHAEPRDAAVQWVREFMDEHYAEPIDLQTLSTLTGYTPNYLNAMFQKATGQAIRGYLTGRRLERALQLCGQSDKPIQAIARSVGYNDPLYFSRVFRQFHGLTPTEARNQSSVR